MDRHGTADRRAGCGQDVTFGLADGVEAPDSYTVVQDADGERRNESELKSCGDEALRGQHSSASNIQQGIPAWAMAGLVAARQQPPSYEISIQLWAVEALSVRTRPRGQAVATGTGAVRGSVEPHDPLLRSSGQCVRDSA
jgi:hypothetical protein